MNVNKYKIGLTFGVFDMIHSGHVNLLQNAKKQCKKLIVCVSSDEYVRKVKNHEPIIPLKERIKVVEALKYVDEVAIQTLTFGKKEAVAKFQPNVLFVGDDWTPSTYTGMNLGVPVVFLPYTKGISSTELRARVSKIL